MKTEFDYIRVNDTHEACELLSHKGVCVLAGGTDLILNIKQGLVQPSLVLDIKNIKALRKLTVSKGVLSVGSLVTFSDLIESKLIMERFPLLMEMAKTVASVSIRNRATMVGNICSAVPCLDSGPVLMVSDAIIHFKDLHYEYEQSIGHFFKAPRKTALKKNQLVIGIDIPLPPKKHGAAYLKLGRYRGEDLAQVSVAVFVLPNRQYKIAFGSVAPVPVRAQKIEALLSGKTLNESLLNEAKDCLESEIAPIDDIRASRTYRLHMAKVMLERALLIACERFEGRGPEYGTSHLDV